MYNIVVLEDIVHYNIQKYDAERDLAEFVTLRIVQWSLPVKKQLEIREYNPLSQQKYFVFMLFYLPLNKKNKLLKTLTALVRTFVTPESTIL